MSKHTRELPTHALPRTERTEPPRLVHCYSVLDVTAVTRALDFPQIEASPEVEVSGRLCIHNGAVASNCASISQRNSKGAESRALTVATDPCPKAAS